MSVVYVTRARRLTYRLAREEGLTVVEAREFVEQKMRPARATDHSEDDLRWLARVAVLFVKLELTRRGCGDVEG